jgi:cysteine desulfurase
VKNVEGETLVLQCDLKGIACSSGSACKGIEKKESEFEPSHVLIAIGIPPEFIKGSLRLTLGRESTENEIEYVIDSIRSIIKNLKQKYVLIR